MKRWMAGTVLLLALALLAPRALAAYKSYKLNDYHDNIKKIQQRLVELDYLSSKPDGWFGEKTKSAVKRFQLVHALEATGVANPETQELLFTDDAKPSPQVLMSLEDFNARMTKGAKLGVQYDLSEATRDAKGMAVEVNNYVVLYCDLLGDDVTEATMTGSDNVKIPFTMLLYAMDDTLSAGDTMQALSQMIEDGERIVNSMLIQYEIDQKGVQRLIVKPIPEGPLHEE